MNTSYLKTGRIQPSESRVYETQVEFKERCLIKSVWYVKADNTFFYRRGSVYDHTIFMNSAPSVPVL